MSSTRIFEHYKRPRAHSPLLPSRHALFRCSCGASPAPVLLNLVTAVTEPVQFLTRFSLDALLCCEPIGARSPPMSVAAITTRVWQCLTAPARPNLKRYFRSFPRTYTKGLSNFTDAEACYERGEARSSAQPELGRYESGNGRRGGTPLPSKNCCRKKSSLA